MPKENEEYEVYAHSNGEPYVEMDDEEPSVLAVPCNRAFVVAPEKALEFKNLKPNSELLKKIEESAKKLNITVELEPIEYSGLVLKKVKKPE